ncbi:MAG TPA: iron-containing redox enzyme family protein, partial [Pseudonocardiaceae bacterium]|nr:iron-containing redox enzyme family protein [Pseudonocardiaceae bacterium]
MPELPEPRGPLSATTLDTLRGSSSRQFGSAAVARADPYGDDLQLALYCCYELHYRGFTGVCADLEWDPHLLGWRRELERPFLAALRADVPGGTDVTGEIDALLVEAPQAGGVSHYLHRCGRRWQLREYVA